MNGRQAEDRMYVSVAKAVDCGVVKMQSRRGGNPMLRATAVTGLQDGA